MPGQGCEEVERDGVNFTDIVRRAAERVDGHFENGFLEGELLPAAAGEGKYEFRVPNAILRSLVMSRYLSALRTELSTALGRSVEVNVVVDKDAGGNGEEKRAPKAAEAPPQPSPKPRPARGFLRGNLKKDYTLDNFIVGDCNRFAWHAVRDVAVKGTSDYYPLYLYSASGLGKSHLLQGLCRALHRNHSHLKISYISCEEFTNEFVASLRTGKQQEFRDRYRNLDVLVVDDVHFLSTKKASQEEFIHTFNALQNASGMLIVSSDAPPHEQKEIHAHLKERFGGGLVLELKLPDYETRVRILTSKLERKLGSGALNAAWRKLVEQIAACNYNNVRQYEGALNRVQFLLTSTAEGGPVSMDRVREVLNDRRTWSFEDCFEVISNHFHVTPEDLKGPSRKRVLSRARAFLILLVREKLGMPYKEIGRKLNRAHSSIMELEKTVRKRIAEDSAWRREWEELEDY